MFQPQLSNPSTIVVHGSEATGKSSIVTEFLKSSGLAHAIVRSQECVTGRHLLERTLASCIESIAGASDNTLNSNFYSRCENISALAAQLQRLLESREGHFTLVFDGIDRQREAPPTLLPALARFGELVCAWTINQREHILTAADTQPYNHPDHHRPSSTLLPRNRHPSHSLSALHARAIPANRLS